MNSKFQHCTASFCVRHNAVLNSWGARLWYISISTHRNITERLSFSRLQDKLMYFVFPCDEITCTQEYCYYRRRICIGKFPTVPTCIFREFLDLQYGRRNCRIDESYIYLYIYRMSQEECARLREGFPFVKVYGYNPKHLCPKLNGYGDKGAKKVWPTGGSTYCTWFAWRNTHTLRIVRSCLQPAQARSSLRLHM